MRRGEREWQRGRRGCGRGGAVSVQFVFFLFCYYRLYFDGGGWSTRACVREAEAKARDFGIGWREIVCQNLLDSVFEYAISIFFCLIFLSVHIFDFLEKKKNVINIWN